MCPHQCQQDEGKDLRQINTDSICPKAKPSAVLAFMGKNSVHGGQGTSVKKKTIAESICVKRWFPVLLYKGSETEFNNNFRNQANITHPKPVYDPFTYTKIHFCILTDVMGQ